LDKLKRVLVPTPTGAQVQIGEIADISFRTGPPDIRDETKRQTVLLLCC
jgi:Cu(I)/Ag(I) efflux system membrane protein CusA/SilA